MTDDINKMSKDNKEKKSIVIFLICQYRYIMNQMITKCDLPTS